MPDLPEEQTHPAVATPSSTSAQRSVQTASTAERKTSTTTTQPPAGDSQRTNELSNQTTPLESPDTSAANQMASTSTNPVSENTPSTNEHPGTSTACLESSIQMPAASSNDNESNNDETAVRKGRGRPKKKPRGRKSGMSYSRDSQPETVEKVEKEPLFTINPLRIPIKYLKLSTLPGHQ